MYLKRQEFFFCILVQEVKISGFLLKCELHKFHSHPYLGLTCLEITGTDFQLNIYMILVHIMECKFHVFKTTGWFNLSQGESSGMFYLQGLGRSVKCQMRHFLCKTERLAIVVVVYPLVTLRSWGGLQQFKVQFKTVLKLAIKNAINKKIECEPSM